MEAREALEEKIRLYIDEQEGKSEIDVEAVLGVHDDLSKGTAFLQNSETLLIMAIDRSRGIKFSDFMPKSGSVEFGWLPYLFKHAHDKDSSDRIIKALQERLQEAFGKGAAKAIEITLSVFGDYLNPKMKPEQWEYLEQNLGKHDIIGNDGSIMGDGKYEDLDEEWLWALVNYLYNRFNPKGIAPFVPGGKSAEKGPYNGPIGEGRDSIRIAVIGDWGTGDFDAGGGYDPASLVMQTVENLEPDYVIHLGDVYYTGTDLRLPPNEEVQNFLDAWPKAFNGRSFTLNSNHEMYGGAQGYFLKALNRADVSASPFSMQSGYSYFALEFGDWVLVGIDAAYHDPSFLYMQGGIGDKGSDPDQLPFLQQVAQQYQGKKIIVFSHQTGMSTDGTTITDKDSGQVLYPLLSQLQQTGITPDYWYWGHVHLGLVYGDTSAVARASGGKTRARCVGHSSIPFGRPWGIAAGGGDIDYIAQTPLQDSHLALNGLALLTLGNDGSIKEAFYNCADAQGKVEKHPQPVWQS